MTAADDKGETLNSAYTGIGKTFGRPQSGNLYDSTSYSGNQYEGMPKSIRTTFSASNQNYYGNYYWMEFTPQHRYYPGSNHYQYENSTSANYYMNNYSFFERGSSLTGSHASFEKFDIGNSGSKTNWDYCGLHTYSEIQAGITKSLGSIFDQEDLALQHQMKQVFGNMDSGKKLLLYKSRSKVDGRYVYVVIDPDTRETASKNYGSNGWSCLVKMQRSNGSSSGTESAQPDRWKVHVFNAPGQNVDLSFKQSHGMVITEDQNTGGSATDSMLSSNTVYGKAPAYDQASVSYSGYGFARNKASVMTGRWVDDRTIFWEFTCNTENWNGWNTSQLYVKVPQGQTLLTGENNFTSDPRKDIDGQTLYPNCVYYKTSGGSWYTMNNSKTDRNVMKGADIKENSPGTTMTGDSIYFIGSSAPSNTSYNATNGSLPKYDGRHTKIGFFTRVDSGSINQASSCQAELIARTGDITEWGSGSGYYGFFPFKVKATGTVPWMPVSKSLMDTDFADGEITADIQDTWKITASSYGTSQGTAGSDLIDTTYTGFYNGSWEAHDDMAESTAAGADEKESSIHPAEYTKLRSMKISANGPGTKGLLFQIDADDISKAETASDHKTSLTKNDLKLTLTYSGNMKDGFDVKADGLKNVSDLEVTYDTVFDQKGFCDAAEDAGEPTDDVYDLNLKNGAACTGWDGGRQPVQSVTAYRKITASLAMDKAVTETPQYDEEHGGYEAGYRLDSQVGYTAADYVSIEDFLLGYKDSGSDTASEKTYSESDTEALGALAKAVDIKDLKITVSGPGFDKTEDIYSGTVRNGQWSGSAENGWILDFVYKPDKEFTEHPGSLYRIRLSRADGSQIPADTLISITYDMETVMDGSDSFRDSKWYSGGDLAITNGGEAAIPYGVSTESWAADTASVNRAVKDTVLKVDCGAGVSATFLAEQLVRKTRLSESSGNSRASWQIYNWTGTKGKNNITSTLGDTLRYDIEEFTYKDPAAGETVKLSAMTDESKKAEIISQLRYLLEKYTRFENISVYYTDTKPNAQGKNLAEKDLLMKSDLSFSGSDQSKTEKKEVTDSKGGSHSIEITTKQLQTDCQDSGFEIKADRLDRDCYLAATYDTETEWKNFYEEANKIYPDCSIITSLKNKASNDRGSEKEESGNRIDIAEDGLSKSLKTSDAAAGKSSWKLKANTGFSKEQELVIKDCVSVNADDGRIKKAAEAALKIDPASIVIKQDDKVIYSEQKIQAEGWTEDNLIVAANGRSLTVTVKNSVDNIVTDAGQDYIAEYDTVLDKDAYIANGGLKDDSAKLQNSAVMERGSASFKSEAESEIKPDIPVKAEKTYDGNGADGADTLTALWTVKGKTGSAGRSDFTLKDKVTSGPEDEAVQNALSMSRFDIAVKTGDAEAKHYTSDSLPKDVELEVNGDAFTLIFSALPEDTTVTVKYAVHLDRKKYIEAGGKETSKLSLKNAFRVEAADGSYDTGSKPGEIEVKKPFTKEGKVASKKAANGNPIIVWDFDVDLYSIYTEDELKSLHDITISDVLSPVLTADLESIKLTDADGTEMPADVYKVTQKRSALAIQVSKPAEHPVLHLQLETECGASIDGLVNQADLRTDGTKITSSKTDDLGRITAVTQHGHIRSMKIPEYTPKAWKYLDNEICTKAGLFRFSIVQVDENGKVIEGGYKDTAENDENGKITFKKITYRDKPVEGSYYYQITETSEVAPYTYTLDDRVFTVRVDVQADGSQYLVTDVVTAPGQYDEVRFDNATVKVRDFTVTKRWKDGDDRSGFRPKAVIVYLLNHGERYEDMAVTLSEENNWTYTWHDLPVANGDYSVEEVPVLGYESDIDTKGWNSTVTNTAAKGSLLVSKQVLGEADKDKKYHFGITLKESGDKDAAVYDLSGTFGEVTFENGRAEFELGAGDYIHVYDLPAGVYYTIEEDDYTKDGFNTPEYRNRSGIVGEDDQTMVTVTNVKPDQTGKPDKPDRPDNPQGQIHTGDDGQPYIWGMIAILALMVCTVLILDHRNRNRYKE